MLEANAAAAPAATPRTGELTFSVQRDLDPALAARWDALYAEITTPSLFQHRAWVQSWFGAYDRGALGEVFFIVAERDGQTQAILPLYRRLHRQWGLPVRSIGLLWNTDLGVRDLPLNTVAERQELLLQALAHGAGHWDVLDLEDLAAGSSALRAFTALSGRAKLAVYHHDSNRLNSAPGGGEQSLSLIPKDHLKKTRRKWRKLAQQGALEEEIFTDAAGIRRGFDTFLRIEDAGWKGSNGNKTSLHWDEPQRRLYETLLTEHFPQLQPGVALLNLNGEPIAAKLWVRTDDTLYLLKICYDENYQEHSPGNLLLLRLLERYADDTGLRHVSFITGGDWTHRWGPERIPVYHCTLYNTTPVGLLIGTAARLKNRLRRIKHRLRNEATAHPASE